MLKGTAAAAGKTDQQSPGEKVVDYFIAAVIKPAVMRCLVIMSM